MQVERINGCTRVIGESQGYIGLPLRDIVVHDGAAGHVSPAMESAWSFDAVELVGLLNGGSLILQLLGSAHPPVVLYVEAGTGAGRNAAADVLEERIRQTSEEGWTPEHDDEHAAGQLLDAAMSYQINALVYAKTQAIGVLSTEELDRKALTCPAPIGWPWDREWWKPKGRRQDLVRAAALIIAEIDRIDRLELKADAP